MKYYSSHVLLQFVSISIQFTKYIIIHSLLLIITRTVKQSASFVLYSLTVVLILFVVVFLEQIEGKSEVTSELVNSTSSVFFSLPNEGNAPN